MGDEGKIYVKEDMVPNMSRLLVQNSDMLLPNATEAELITGHKIDSI